MQAGSSGRGAWALERLRPNCTGLVLFRRLEPAAPHKSCQWGFHRGSSDMTVKGRMIQAHRPGTRRSARIPASVPTPEGMRRRSDEPAKRGRDNGDGDKGDERARTIRGGAAGDRGEPFPSEPRCINHGMDGGQGGAASSSAAGMRTMRSQAGRPKALIVVTVRGHTRPSRPGRFRGALARRRPWPWPWPPLSTRRPR